MIYTNEQIKKRRNKEIKIKKCISIIMYLLLIPIMIYNLSLIYGSIVNPNETPSFFGIKTYVIISGSMEPNLNIGDIVIARSIENQEEEIKVGDIISYRKGHSVITHRIVDIKKDENGILRITAKGDNNNVKDSEDILINNIEGKVIGVISKLGKITMLLQDKTILIVALILLYMSISRGYKASQRKNDRRIKRLEYERNRKRGEM